MEKEKTIIITGAAGFIGSYFTGFLNKKGYENLILVDEFDDDEKELNLHGKKWLVRVEREDLVDWLSTEKPVVDFFFHLGARTDTTEFDYSVHEKLNLEYSKDVWNYCTYHTVPLVYASSAATYGDGALGYYDDHDLVEKLKPLNPYGVSKNEFDKWALGQSQNSPFDRLRVKNQEFPTLDSRLTLRQAQGKLTNDSRPTTPPFWSGLKFFNVYGPNEYHKGRMASMVYHGFNQIQSGGKVRLFRSHRPDFKDGEQLRDFIYVGDVAKVMLWFMQEITKIQKSKGKNQKSTTHPSTGSGQADSGLTTGLYNLGTGKARTFNDLVCTIFKSMDLHSQIEYIDTPVDIRDKYQYFTEAKMDKLKMAGYPGDFLSLEDGIGRYVKDFLIEKKYY